MNNFTKTELESIFKAVHGTYFDAQEILKKLQYMIDNYCEQPKLHQCSRPTQKYVCCYCGKEHPNKICDE